MTKLTQKLIDKWERRIKGEGLSMSAGSSVGGKRLVYVDPQVLDTFEAESATLEPDED